MQEVLVARCTLPRVNEGEEFLASLNERALVIQYPDFVAEVHRLSAQLEKGAPVCYYWTSKAALESDKGGVIAWRPR